MTPLYILLAWLFLPPLAWVVTRKLNLWRFE